MRRLPFHPRGQAGVFWVPGSPERTVAGTYHVTDDGGVEVDLHGTLAGDSLNEIALLHGDVEGMPVSLLDCGLLGARPRRAERRTRSRPVSYSQWWVRSAVENAHTDPETATYDRIDITVPHLGSWSHSDRELFTGDLSQIRQREEQPPSPTARVPGADITLNTWLGGEYRASGTLTFRQEQVLSIHTDRPRTYDDLWATYVRPLVTLLTLAISRPLRPDVTHLSDSTSRKARTHPEVRRHRGDAAEADGAEAHYAGLDMLWELPDLDFSTSIERWFDLDSRAALSLTLHQQAQHGEGASPATRFLNAVIAAESLHRELYAPNQQPSLKASLESLVAGGGAPATKVLKHPGPWTAKVTRARHDLAHGNKAGMDLLGEPARLQAMADSVTGIVTLRLMSELGFTDAQVADLTQSWRHVWAAAARTACA